MRRLFGAILAQMALSAVMKLISGLSQAVKGLFCLKARLPSQYREK
jgi:hypothetical protein